ncbi:MAG: hypothetical protein AB1422_04085 [bacterium]
MYYKDYLNNLFCDLIYFYVFSVSLRLCGKLPPERLDFSSSHLFITDYRIFFLVEAAGIEPASEDTKT